MRNRRGYILLELVIGAAITCAMSAVLFQLAVASQSALAIQGNAADQQQRLRVATEALRHDLMMAGAGPARGTRAGPLIAVFPPLIPARIGVMNPDPELTARTDRISIVFVPESRSQTTLRSGMAGFASPLAIDENGAGCIVGTACDFAVGDRALIYDASGTGGAYETFTVAAIDTARALIAPSAPLNRAYATGARVSIVAIRTYYFDAAGKRLMVYDGDRSDLPLVDHVTDMRVAYVADAPTGLLTTAQLADGPVLGESPNRFDGDLLRVRRVRVTVRLQGDSASASVGDLVGTIEVSPPNMAVR
jgi:hypothetical protein